MGDGVDAGLARLELEALDDRLDGLPLADGRALVVHSSFETPNAFPAAGAVLAPEPALVPALASA